MNYSLFLPLGQIVNQHIADHMFEIRSHFECSGLNESSTVTADGSHHWMGDSFAAMVLLELKQCQQFSKQQVEQSLARIRGTFGPYMSNGEFRSSAKRRAIEWALNESEHQGLTQHKKQVFIGAIDHLLSVALVPVDATFENRELVIKGLRHPLTFEETEVSTEYLGGIIEYHRALPAFEGIFDFVDEETAGSITCMLPSAVAAPQWYALDFESPNAGGIVNDSERLYEAVTKEYPKLKEPHFISVDDALVEAVKLAEFEGRVGTKGQFRCLAAVVHYRNHRGAEVYMALTTPHLTTSHLLIGEEIFLDGLLPTVAGRVLRAFSQALREETGLDVDVEQYVTDPSEENAPVIQTHGLSLVMTPTP